VAVSTAEVLAAQDVRHQLDPAVLHAAHAQHAIRDGAQAIGLAPDDDHLHAQVMAQVDVQGGPHRVAQLVLQLRQLVGQVAHVVVVDQRQRRHRIHPAGHLGPGDLGPRQIAEQLGAGAAALPGQDVDLLQQRGVDGHAEADEVGFHPQDDSIARPQSPLGPSPAGRPTPSGTAARSGTPAAPERRASRKGDCAAYAATSSRIASASRAM